MESLIKLLKQSPILNTEIIHEVTSYCVLQNISKGKILISPGDFSDKIYFVKKGLLREYYYESKYEVTNQIVIEDTFFYSTEAFINDEQSKVILETLEDSELICIRKKAWKDLGQRYPSLLFFENSLIKTALVGFEKRMRMFRLKEPLQKLETFEQLHPKLSNRLNSKVLASYLGIASQTLSTVRTERSKKSSK
jgi:CRP-like cAMP-binding protein